MLNGTLDYQASDECPRLRDYEEQQAFYQEETQEEKDFLCSLALAEERRARLAFNQEEDECLHTTDYWTDPTPSALAFKDMVGDTTDYALYDDPF